MVVVYQYVEFLNTTNQSGEFIDAWMNVQFVSQADNKKAKNCEEKAVDIWGNRINYSLWSWLRELPKGVEQIPNDFGVRALEVEDRVRFLVHWVILKISITWSDRIGLDSIYQNLRIVLLNSQYFLQIDKMIRFSVRFWVLGISLS